MTPPNVTPDGESPGRPVFGPPQRDLRLGQRYTRWAMWGCASVLLVLLLLGGGFLLVAMQQPGYPSLLRFARNIAECRDHLVEVSGALDRYHTDKGKLPARLEDLYPTYLAKREYLYCPADVPSSPKGTAATTDAVNTGPNAPRPKKPGESSSGRWTSYVLRSSQGWGKGDGIVVYCPHHPDPNADPARPSSARRQFLVIRQDGKVDAMVNTLADMRRGDHQAGSPPAAPRSR